MTHEIKRAFKNAKVDDDEYGAFEVTPLVLQYDKEARELFDGRELDQEDKQDLAITKKRKRKEPIDTSLELNSANSKTSSLGNDKSSESEQSDGESSSDERHDETEQEDSGIVVGESDKEIQNTETKGLKKINGEPTNA